MCGGTGRPGETNPWRMGGNDGGGNCARFCLRLAMTTGASRSDSLDASQAIGPPTGAFSACSA